MKRVLLTGAGGFVGARILQQLGGRLTLIPVQPGVLRSAGQQQVERLVAQIQPDVILHTAAVSDTGYSEAHPEESYRANVLLPVWLAQAARTAGAGLVCFSSDQVYAGLAGEGPFAEDTPLHPANVYGRHKWEAEQRVLDIWPRSVHLRATWMYDLPGYGLPVRGNLPLTLLRAALLGEEVVFSPRERRSVTYVRQVVENLLLALELPGGVYNFGSENELDMYETARRFCETLHIAPALKLGDRQRSLAIDGSKARRHGILFDSAVAGIARCVQDYALPGLF